MIYPKPGTDLSFDHRSFIHTLDIRVKLLWVLLNTGLIMASRNLFIGLIIWSVSTLLARLSHRPLRELGIPIRSIILLTIQLMLIQGFLHSQGTLLAHAGPLRLYSGGVLLGLRSGIEISAIIMIWLQFSGWSTALELRLALEKYGLPFRMAFLAALAVRFFPIVRTDLRLIYESQISRGLDLDGYLKKIKALPPIILPLIMKTIRRSEAVALAMEMKGFGTHSRPTSLMFLKLSAPDLFALGATMGYGILVLLINYDSA